VVDSTPQAALERIARTLAADVPAEWLEITGPSAEWRTLRVVVRPPDSSAVSVGEDNGEIHVWRGETLADYVDGSDPTAPAAVLTAVRRLLGR
jgi:hypothetical protein